MTDEQPALSISAPLSYGSRRAISKTVWRKGWQREAQATQAASAAVSGVIHWFNEQGFPEVGAAIRQYAMEVGARKAEAHLSRQIAAWVQKRRIRAVRHG